MMKKLTMITLACIASFACFGATYEENLELASTPTNQVTHSNAMAICNAAVAVTNYKAIAYCRDAGFVTYEQVADMLEGKVEFLDSCCYNAYSSSNATIRARAISNLVSIVKSQPHGYYSMRTAVVIAYWLPKYKFSLDMRMRIAQDLLSSGKKTEAMNVIYFNNDHNISKIFFGKDNENLEYTKLCADMYDELLAEWLDYDPVLGPNGTSVIRFDYDGRSIIDYAVVRNIKLTQEAIDKVVKYADAGQQAYLSAHSCHKNVKMYRKCPELASACMNAYIKSNLAPKQYQLVVAKSLDIIHNNKNATLSLYPKLKKFNDIVDTARYLKDADKLIDTLKVVDDSLPASTVERAIPVLNNINAGYRTDDLRLALMNVNKKYTLKLYNDHKAWEPILSKIRAMINAL